MAGFHLQLYGKRTQGQSTSILFQKRSYASEVTNKQQI